MLLKAAPCLAAARKCENNERMSAVLLTYADVLQHRHDFAGAERVLDSVLQTNTADSQARLMRANIRLAQGRAREATRDCSALIGRMDAVVTTACVAQAISLDGRLSESHALLANTLNQRMGRNEQEAWAFAVLAELAERDGMPGESIAAMDKSLSGDPTRAALRIQAADLLLRTNQPTRVLEVLQPLSPGEPVLLRRAIAAQRLNAPNAEAIARQWQLARKRADELGLPKHERDVALGELEIMERPERALHHALLNWNTTHEIDDMRVVLRAARASGRLEAATPVLEWIDRHRIEDVVIAQLRSGAAL